MTDPALDRNLPHIRDMIIGRPTDVAIAERLEQRMRDRVICVDSVFYDWVGTHWRALPASVLPAFVQRLDGLNTGVRPPQLQLNSRRIDSITRLLAQRLDRPGYFDAQAQGINALNGFVAFDAIGKPSRKPHSADLRQRHVVPARWNDGAEDGPLWRQLTAAVFGSDARGSVSTALIEEILGLTLAGMTDLSDRRLVLLAGPVPDVHKRELLAVFHGLLDARWCASIPTFNLSDRDALAALEGCRINLSNEYGDEPLPSTLRSLLTGSPVRLGRGTTARTSVGVVHVITMTGLPRVGQPLPPALARRIAIVELVAGDGGVGGIAAQILETEPDALLARAVRGAGRVIAHGGVSDPPGSTAAVERWSRGIDLVELFLASGVVKRDPDGRVSSRDVHARYLDWARRTGEPLLTLPTLVSALERGGAVRRTSTGRKRLLAGLALV